MIGYISGFIKAHGDESVLVLAGGVGYEVFCSQQTLMALHAEIETELWIYTHVREDQLMLYGFTHPSEKHFFMSLLKVNGIGPKVAIKILSAAPAADIIKIIDQGDVKALSSLPKVGKKIAEQIILDLKGKLSLPDSPDSNGQVSIRADVVSALVNLGFRLSDVEKVVATMDLKSDLQTGIRRGLQALTAQN